MKGRDYIQFGELRLPVVGGLHGFDSSSGYDYGQYNLATGKPMIAPAGEQLRQITLRIMLRHYLGDNIKSIIETIEDMKQSGNAHDLVFVNGIYKGKYVIQSIRDSIDKTLPDGTILEYETTIDILEYASRKVLETVEKSQQPAVAKKGTVNQSQKKQQSNQKVNDKYASGGYYDVMMGVWLY